MDEDTSVKKRSLALNGHKTSVSLEDAFWNGLLQIARERNVTVSEVVREIQSVANPKNLSSAIRLFVLGHFRQLAEAKKRGPERVVIN